jgi:hypothetical protein
MGIAITSTHANCDRYRNHSGDTSNCTSRQTARCRSARNCRRSNDYTVLDALTGAVDHPASLFAIVLRINVFGKALTRQSQREHRRHRYEIFHFVLLPCRF